MHQEIYTILHILVIKIIVKTEKGKHAMSILNPMQNPYNTERLKNVIEKNNHPNIISLVHSLQSVIIVT